MSDIRVAINGFGRIGRLVFRHLMRDHQVKVVAFNDVAPLDNLVYLLRHDTVHRAPGPDFRTAGESLVWDDREVRYLSVKDPAELPWGDLDVQLVLEASGLFTHRDDATKHLEAGAERVLITAPGKGGVPTFCPGVNHRDYDPQRHRVISNASCTTNCLAPVAKVLHETFGIRHGALTTIHAYTASQNTVDGPSNKWRRGRAAAANIVPTTTGAAKATTEVLPELEGRLDGMAMRVPVAAGSIVDFVATTEQQVSVEAVNDTFRRAADGGDMGRALAVTDEELVSSDVIGLEASALVDLPSTMVFGDRMTKVLAWYDNEWGYARAVCDMAHHVADTTWGDG